MKALVLIGLLAINCFANTSLNGAWSLASSADVHDTGEVVSTLKYDASEWLPVNVPTTVMAALVNAKIFADPNVGMNLRETPGVSYPSGYNFSTIPMPPNSPFRVSWWYRKRFQLAAGGKRQHLHFDGINFRANIWLNGRKIAGAQEVAGMWRTFAFDVTGYLNGAKDNVLAVEVFPPTPHDLANTYADWNPMPPDKNMGIWRGVFISDSGPVEIRYPQVVSKVSSELDHAEVTASAELVNNDATTISGELKGQVGDVAGSAAFSLGPKEVKTIYLKPFEINRPKLWWPIDMGEPTLQSLKLQAIVAGEVSDSSETRFGIREVTSELVDQDASISGGKNEVPKKNLLFKINGKKILIRGGGYTFDMLLRSSPEKQEAELDYVRDMHLNAVRFEGKLEDDHFLDLADEKGILVMAGWTCCDHWEEWKKWNAEDYLIASESLRDQIHRLRSHPSVFVWLNGSDNPPPPEQEERYIAILKELKWPNPFISSATSRVTKITGESGVKMLGPYDYVSPTYWLTAHSLGGAYGFNTETGPGPAVPPIATLEKFLPRDHLWPIDSFWSYHSGGGAFRTLDVFNEAMNKRYGAPANLQDYTTRAQIMAYEGERAMFEAFGRNKYVATGVIQWMLNNAWPSMIWHLYDYYLRPGGAYFGAKKGCEPLHIQYSYDDASVVVVNSYQRDYDGLTATAEVFNQDLSRQFSKSVQLNSKADSVSKLFAIPVLAELSPTYFVRLVLTKSGKEISNNFYWMPRQPDVLDFAKSNGNLTPTKTFGSLQSLNDLAKTTVATTMAVLPDKDETVVRVNLKNTGRTLAFSLDLRLLSEKEEILPVRWQDNYVSLLPGESRSLEAKVRTRDWNKKPSHVTVQGWNVDPISFEP